MADGAAPVVTVPLAALLNDGRGASVWRLTADGLGVEPLPVEIVSLGERVAHLRGPLADGDRVVSLGAQRIDPARAVRVV